MCQLAMNFWMGSSIYGLFYQHRIIALLRFPTDLETNQTNFRAQGIFVLLKYARANFFT